MKTLRIACAVILLNASLGAHATDELTPAKRADIQKVLEMTGSAAIGKQMAMAMVNQLGGMLRKSNPNLPADFMAGVSSDVEAVLDEALPQFHEMVIPLYSKYFTHVEVREMAAFYASPLGRKTIETLPALMAESMALGQKWGMSMGPEIQKRVMARCEKAGCKP